MGSNQRALALCHLSLQRPLAHALGWSSLQRQLTVTKLRRAMKMLCSCSQTSSPWFQTIPNFNLNVLGPQTQIFFSNQNSLKTSISRLIQDSNIHLKIFWFFFYSHPQANTIPNQFFHSNQTPKLLRIKKGMVWKHRTSQTTKIYSKFNLGFHSTKKKKDGESWTLPLIQGSSGMEEGHQRLEVHRKTREKARMLWEEEEESSTWRECVSVGEKLKCVYVFYCLICPLTKNYWWSKGKVGSFLKTKYPCTKHTLHWNYITTTTSTTHVQKITSILLNFS